MRRDACDMRCDACLVQHAMGRAAVVLLDASRQRLSHGAAMWRRRARALVRRGRVRRGVSPAPSAAPLVVARQCLSSGAATWRRRTRALVWRGRVRPGVSPAPSAAPLAVPRQRLSGGAAVWLLLLPLLLRSSCCCCCCCCCRCCCCCCCCCHCCCRCRRCPQPCCPLPRASAPPAVPLPGGAAYARWCDAAEGVRASLRSLSALGRVPHCLAVAVAVGVVAPQRSSAAFCRSCAGVVPTNDGVAMSGRNRARAARAHLPWPHRRFGQLGLTHGSAVL